MSFYERERADGQQPRARKATAARAREWGRKALTTAQKTRLAMLVKEAYTVQEQAGLVDGDEKTFRHEQVAVATGKAGLRECDNSNFRAIKAHFLRLAGRENEAAAQWAKTGRVQGSEEIGDTHENRETALAVLRETIALSGGLVSEEYARTIAADQCGGREMEEMTASELQTLVYTVVQRLRKRLGITQAQSAAIIGVPERTYWEWEAGKTAPYDITQEGALSRLKTKKKVRGG